MEGQLVVVGGFGQYWQQQEKQTNRQTGRETDEKGRPTFSHSRSHENSRKRKSRESARLQNTFEKRIPFHLQNNNIISSNFVTHVN